MKKSAYGLAALLAVLMVVGCQCNKPSGGTGTTTTTTNREAANTIQIVFTNAPPAAVVAKLQAVGATPDSTGLIFTLRGWDFHNQPQEAAIEAALRAGATLKGTQ